MRQTQEVETYCNSWRWSKHEEYLVSKWIVGRSLHVCCGMSKLGDIRFDIDPQVNPTIVGDILNNTLAPKQAATVISDPAWNLGFIPKYWKELKRLAKKRIIVIALSQMMEGKDWHIIHEQVIKRPNGFQVKVLTVYERKSNDIEGYTEIDSDTWDGQ